MDPTLPLDQRASAGNRTNHQRGQGGSSGNASSKPTGKPHASSRSTPGHSPLPSTTTMPLSLQQLGSAASSTDSLNGPVYQHSANTNANTPGLRHHQSSSYLPSRTASHSPHVTTNSGQGIRVSNAVSANTRRTPTSEATATAMSPVYDYSKSSSVSHGSAYGFKRGEPSASIYSASSARSTSSVNSLPPASESNLSASTVTYAHNDAKGKGRGLITSLPAAVTSRKRVPSEIEEAVRNLGLAPPRSPVKVDSTVSPTFLSVPGTRQPAGSPHQHYMSRTASANTSAASASDAASLSGTIASSIASTSQDSHSISSKRSTTSKTKKKKVKTMPSHASTTTTTTVIKASSSGTTARGSAESSATTSDARAKKKKKKSPLPTSSGKPAASAPSPNTVSPAPSSPRPSTRSTQAKSPRHLDSRSTTSSVNTAPTQPHTSISHAPGPAMPLHRPVPQSPPSRNRHLDESALLRRFPASSSPSTNASGQHTQPTARSATARAQPSSASAPNAPNAPTAQAPLQANRTAPSTGISESRNDDQTAPPAWSPPLQTITLAFTPMHAYLSAYHDPADHTTAGAARQTPPTAIPDSPPPAFRSRSPSPEAGPSGSRRNSQGSVASNADSPYLSDVDLDALEERSRGYASSENELDLLNSQGRHSGTSTPPVDIAHGDSKQGLRWQLRHWEAWRREGISLEERLQRLEQWKKATAQPVSPSTAMPTTCAQQMGTSNTAERPFQSILEERRSPPAEPASNSDAVADDRHVSPQRAGVSQAAASSTSQPRFPSVGTVRRARLQRFEAERQHSKSMSAVVQSSPASSGVSLPRGRTVRQESTDMPSGRSAIALDDSRPSEELRSAMLHAALGRHPVGSTQSTDRSEGDNSEQGANAQVNFGDSFMPKSSEVISLAPQSEASPAPRQAQLPAPHAHQLARQLAAEVEMKRVSSGSTQLSSLNSAHSLDRSSEAQPADSSEPALASRSSSDLPTKPPVDTTSTPKQLQKAASRISRLFRPNMGPRPQRHRTDIVKQDQGEDPKEAASADPSVIDAPAVMPIMTLPKAPPRLTTDPLSTDNLRKLSKRQLRSPSVHGAVSPSSSSEESEIDSDSTSAEEISDSGSDSADDESTKKPPSTVTHLGQRVPSSLVSSFANVPEADREAAAASWRRTEDGRRHSALLSRPLSIKRKPPPVPPKRWGGVWDRDVIQERLKRSFNLLDIAEQADSDEAALPNQLASRDASASRHVMPGSLGSVAEDDSWEVIGQESASASSAPPVQWEVVGQPVRPSYTDSGSRNDAADPIAPEARRSETRRVNPHVYSEADFSTPRRQAPPIPSTDRLLPPAELPERTSLEGPRSPERQIPLNNPVSLHRAPAVRRPQSVVGGLRTTSTEGGSRENAESVRPSPPSPEIRSRLSSRPRHVYSASVPSVTTAHSPQPPTAGTRRPLPPLPGGSVGSAPTTPRRFLIPGSPVPSRFEGPAASRNSEPTSDVFESPARGSVDVPSPPSHVQEYTDLEVMLSSMDERGVGNSSQVLREVLGVSQPATAEEIDSLPVGRVELERRRVDKKGKIKQKLSCVGINCNKCQICLQQFKEDELAVVLPVCLEVFHAEPCMRAYLTTNNRCPSCQAALM